MSGADKRLATLIAAFALKGHTVHSLLTGGYLVAWHGYTRHCSDIAALESFAAQVGVEVPA